MGVLATSAEEQCASDGSCSNKPLKIVIIGASPGTTGGLFMKLALDAGHSVTAIARTPSKVEEMHENLTVVQGNVRDPETLIEPMKGADIVIGAFGHRAFSDTFKTTTLYSDGVKAVLDAMKQSDVKRLIMLSSSGTAYIPGASFIWDFMLRVSTWRLCDYTCNIIANRSCFSHQPFMWRFYADMSEMDMIVGESDLDWTILRPPQLMDEQVPGKVVHSVEKPDSATNWVAQVSRADLAQVLFDVMEQNLYSKKRVYVYTVP